MEVEGYVLFNNSEGKWWKEPWRLFTQKGYRHCRILIRHNIELYYGEVELWTLYDGAYAGTVVYPIIANDFDELMKGIDYDDLIYVKYELDDKPIVRFGFTSCVSVIKSLLGKIWWSVLTPKQLHKKLLKEGFGEI